MRFIFLLAVLLTGCSKEENGGDEAPFSEVQRIIVEDAQQTPDRIEVTNMNCWVDRGTESKCDVEYKVEVTSIKPVLIYNSKITIEKNHGHWGKTNR